MKKLLGIAAAMVVASAPAFAATLHFGAEAKNNERGVADNTVLGPNANIEEAVKLSSSHFAYLDHDSNSNAGLGVCKVLTNPGNQCNPSSDDNVTMSEWVMLTFLRTQSTLSGLVFRGSNHGGVNASDTLLISENGGANVRYTFGAASAKVFNNITSLKFSYDDGENTANQFYINKMTTTPVPLPAGFVLLGTAFGVLGLARRRKKTG